ncbi:hypothetical protein [Bordetella genomosp. 13]|uniref:hypothetical protein n=1 Tax=Bordetella genomosp. 13 TaxID=463040 RepID=UPI00119CDC0B|nr:hypothetical protein [Bordetella genomosp. 13]
MTTVSAVSRSDLLPVQPVQTAVAAPVQQAVTSTAVPPASSTSVALGQSDDGAPVYTAEGRLPSASRIWDHSANDTVTLRMAANFGTTSASGRLGGLGSALLERAMAGGQFAQSVWTAGSSALSLDAVRTNLSLPQTGNYVAMDVKTAGGATVRLAIGSQDDAMSVQMQVTGGTLSDTEQAALAKLAKGFQAALDGLTGQPPKLDLSGLTQYDGSAIKSIDLSANIKTAANQNLSLTFHANAQSRGVQLDGPEGTVQVDVDMSKSAMLGNAAQRERAVDNYLQQFNDASSRGRGGAALMDMFKSAFSDLHGDYGSAAGQPQPTSRLGGILNDTSRAMLTGLADFTASVADHARAINPLRPGETDGFSYQASQSTDTGGSGRSFNLKQTQQSQLTASFHDALSPELSLMLTTDPLSQNYYYYQVKDSASSTANLAFEDGKMVKASLQQTADQSRRVMKYVRGQLEEDTTTPLQQAREWNLLAMVEAAQQVDKTTARPDGSRLKATLSTISDLVLLQSNPARLGGKPSGDAAST